MKRFVSFLLVVSILCSLIIPVGAASASTGNKVPVVGVLYDKDFRDLMDAKLTIFNDLDKSLLKDTILWPIIDYAVDMVGFGGFASYRDLVSAANTLNANFSNPASAFWSGNLISASILSLALNGLKGLKWTVRESPEYGYIILDSVSGVPLVNSAGAFPYYKETTVDTGGNLTDGSESLGGRWVRSDKITTTQVVITELDVLQSMSNGLNNTGRSMDKNYIRNYKDDYKVIASNYEEQDNDFIYCDSEGRPFVTRRNNDQYVVNTPNDYYVDNSTNNDTSYIYNEGDTVNEVLVDLTNNTTWFPDGTFNYINNLVYDESTKTYYVDARSEFNTTNNYYYTYNYHYEYHINYTSITYIGTSAEYNKTYELYYELPDGRSSADLTVDELQALNLSVDVVPYIRSADTTALRGLYHFDGNTFDSSYWNYCTDFQWNTGASISYLDSGTFNGSLYLDETTHDFTVFAPSSLGSNDFTIQWRMYQSATQTPVSDSYVALSGQQLLTFSGAYVGFNGGQYAVPIGNWFEVALVRDSRTLRLYLNGIQVASVSTAVVFGREINFHFGSEQQTYKQLDELRILNYPLVTGGASYTPTAVPYDTNLTLVLPDSSTPVADEYWEVTSSRDNLLSDYGLDDPSTFLESEYFNQILTNDSELSNMSGGLLYRNSFPAIYSLSEFNSYDLSSGAFSITSISGVTPIVGAVGSGSYGWYYALGSLYYRFWHKGFSTGIAYFDASGVYTTTAFAGTHTFSLAFDDGEVASFTFTNAAASISLPDATSGARYLLSWIDYVESHGYRIGLLYVPYGKREYHSSNKYAVALAVAPLEDDVPGDAISYLELVEGDATDLSVEKVSAIAPVSSDYRSPTLAVRTDQTITGYQIGGVRPSLPTKGLVWGLVEDSRITSLQIYNGQAWEAVDGRIWTGSRWVPYYAYDVLLLKDMYDVIEADPSQDYIYTESGFWSWLQKAWTQMIAKLEEIRLAVSGGSGGTGTIPGDPEDPNYPGGEEDDGEKWSFLDLVGALRDGVWKVTVGVVDVALNGVSGLVTSVDDIGNFFDLYRDGPGYWKEGDPWN